MSQSPELLDELVQAVRSSARYGALNAAVIRRVGQRELAARRNLRQAAKATKSVLHRVAGVYLSERPDYGRWLDELSAAHSTGGEAGLRATCRALMASHISTRERLPLLESFYARTLGDLAPVHSLLDLACGLHPLAIPWMPLAPGASYLACDMVEDLVGFLGELFTLFNVRGRAWSCDVLGTLPEEEVEVALLLKALPCLEQLDRAAASALLERIPARHLLVSFPVRSLGGRDVHMPAYYAGHLMALLQDKSWHVERYDLETELVFRVDK